MTVAKPSLVRKGMLFLAIASVISFSSCSKYQYVALTSSAYQTDTYEIVEENDTVKVSYTFTGANCPINIKVYNKTLSPIYVDWSKSAVIINGQRYSYWVDQSTINANIEGTEIRWTEDISSQNASIQGTIHKNEKVSFIPPESFVISKPINIRTSSISLDETDKKEKKIQISSRVGEANAYKYTFTKDDSPVSFRSYITYSTNSNLSNPKHFDTSFWANEVLATQLKPDAITLRPNQFYLSAVKNNSSGVILITTGGLLAILTILSMQ